MAAKRQLIYQGSALTLNVERVTFPDGRQGELEIVRHPGGAAAVAVDVEGRVCMIRHYRYAVDAWLWEVPAGRLEPGEAPATTAARELAEEAGVKAGQWSELGVILPSPGICDEHIHLFFAQQLSATPMARDPLEFIEVHWIPLPEAIRWAQQGEIADAKTLVALFRVQSRLQGKFSDPS
jgi:8-oxo-dGTP pyrophosphatase MutT (NUDIX family)